MEAKLIKVLEHYHLYDGDKAIATTIVGNPMLLPNLSLKNCQAIENGYDLDKLAKEKYPYEKTEMFSCFELDCKQEGFIEGAKAILEILGDKKFSEEDVEKAFEMGEDFGSLPFSSYTTSKRLNKKEYIQSIQQTEWDVIIEMEIKQQLINGYKNQPDNVIGFIAEYENMVVPKLDADGCLILKCKI